jgi:hypothetical protein
MKSLQAPHDVVGAAFELATRPDAWEGSVSKVSSDGVARVK